MYNLKWLLERLGAGETFRYLLFWGHAPAPAGQTSKGCLSQWYDSSFEHEGVLYATAEHWMMAGKARLFGDSERLEKMLRCATPGEAKALGRQVSGFDPVVWNEHKFDIVRRGNLLKFAQNADLLEFLLSTGDAVLVEASPFDRIWGIGISESNPSARNPLEWKGENLLGFALMAVRDELTGKK